MPRELIPAHRTTPCPTGCLPATRSCPSRHGDKDTVLRGWQRLLLASVGLQDGVDPVAELGDAGVHAGRLSVAGAAAPGDDAHQVPGAVLLAHQRTPGVALHGAAGERRGGARGRRGQRGPGARTMQEEAPSAPAQTITSRMRKPQNSLHWALVSRGRATCCSTAGVCEAAGSRGASAPAPGMGTRTGTGRGGDEEDRTVMMVEMGTGLGQGWELIMGMGNGTGMKMGIREWDGDSDLDGDLDGRVA